MTTRIEVRSGTSAEWAAANPVLNEGEVGYDSTVDKIKVGDGTAQWSALAFQGGSGGGLATEEIDLTFNGSYYRYECALSVFNPTTHQATIVGWKKHATEWATPISDVVALGDVKSLSFASLGKGGYDTTLTGISPGLYFKKTSDSTWTSNSLAANGDKIIAIIIKVAK